MFNSDVIVMQVSFLLGRVVVVTNHFSLAYPGIYHRFVPSSFTAGEVLATTATKWDSQEMLIQ